MTTRPPPRRRAGTYLRDTYNPRKGLKSFAVGIVIVLILLFVGGCFAVKSVWSGNVTFTITDKTVKRSGDSDQYLIFTNKGTFKDTDSILFFKFDSSDLYGKLLVGHTYNCDTFGYRLGLTSSYKNLINCKEVAP